MRLSAIVTLSVALCCALNTNGQTVDASVCRAQGKCGECQSAGRECHWCSDAPFNGSRCDLSANLLGAGCQRMEFISSTVTPTEDRDISDSVLLSPQRVTAYVMKGRPAVFTVRVQLPQSRSHRRRLSLRTRKVPDFMDVAISSNCLRSRGSSRRRTCPSVNPGTVVEFQVEIGVKRCGNRRRNSIRLKMSGYNIRGNVRVDVIDVCTCPCEFYSVLASSEPSEYCNDNGETLCGLCHCYPGYNGDRCECRSSHNGNETMEQCTPEQGITEVCSGRGECICGNCQCQNDASSNTSVPRFSGKYCQCDNQDCPAHGNQICGGLSRGQCACGQCVCQAGYRGTACEVSEDTSACVGENGMLCNGRGMCHGGRCDCDGPYSGPTCGECLTCMERCESLRSCVQCWVFRTGPITTPEECETQCSALDITLVDNIDTADVGTRICSMVDEDDGRIAYSYVYAEDGSMVVLVNRPPESDGEQT